MAKKADKGKAAEAAYINYMRPRCVELARVLRKTGSFYYHCDWHAWVMLDIFCFEKQTTE